MPPGPAKAEMGKNGDLALVSCVPVCLRVHPCVCVCAPVLERVPLGEAHQASHHQKFDLLSRVRILQPHPAHPCLVSRPVHPHFQLSPPQLLCPPTLPTC